MRYPILLVWALACLVVIHGRSLSPRQSIQTSQQTSQQTSVATSFSQVTKTYSSISTYFVQTRQTIQSATSIEQCSSILTQLTTQISQAVQSISGGCNCDVDGVDTNTLQSMISTWFSELQAITQLLQSRFPTSYQSYFSSTFTQISSHMELALGVGYSAGVNMDSVVQQAVHRSNVNTSLLSSFKIDTSRFTHISQAVTNRVGVFSSGPPGGYRFPHRLPGGYNPPSHSPPVKTTNPTIPGHTTTPGHTTYPSPHPYPPGTTQPGTTREPGLPTTQPYHNPYQGNTGAGSTVNSPYSQYPAHGLPNTGNTLNPNHGNGWPTTGSATATGSPSPYQRWPNTGTNTGYTSTNSPYGQNSGHGMPELGGNRGTGYNSPYPSSSANTMPFNQGSHGSDFHSTPSNAQTNSPFNHISSPYGGHNSPYGTPPNQPPGHP